MFVQLSGGFSCLSIKVLLLSLSLAKCYAEAIEVIKVKIGHFVVCFYYLSELNTFEFKFLIQFVDVILNKHIKGGVGLGYSIVFVDLGEMYY